MDKFMKHYRFIDWISQGYAAFFLLLVLGIHSDRAPEWPALVALHLASIALIHGLILKASSPCPSPFWAAARDLYPIACYIVFYRDTGTINRLLTARPFDPWLIQLEHSLFGSQPSVSWMTTAPTRWVSEPLYAAYFSFYLMIAGLGFWFRFRQRAVFPQFITVVSFLLYASYLTYFFVPAVGPRQFFVESAERELFLQLYGHTPTEVPGSILSGAFARLMGWIYENLETWGAAFPSSHVAVAWGTTWFSWRYLPKVRWVHLLASILLTISTIYCRYHYAVDALAGVAFCALLLPLALWLHRKLDSAPQEFR